MGESQDEKPLTARLNALREIMDERDRRYEERFIAMDQKTSLALTSSKEAVTKAEAATEKRFDSVNEFRGSLKDQAANLLPRAEADVKFTAIAREIDELKKNTNLSQGRSTGFSASWGIAVSLMLLAMALIGLLLRMKP